ncbi:MFS transporter [Pseudomonas psychrophila]|nr:MFS transporter [Pseudomonas psychrophila]
MDTHMPQTSAKIHSFKRRSLMLVITCLGMFSGSYAQFQLPPLAARLIPELGITNPEFASLVTAPMIPSILLGIIAGILCDRMGIKKIIGIGLAFGAFGGLARLFATNYTEMMIFLAFSGAGSAFLNANLAKIISSWFPPEQMSKVMGIVLMAGTGGMVIGMGTTALFPSTDSAFIFGGCLCLVSTILWLIVVRDNRIDVISQAEPAESLLAILSVTAKNPALWTVGFCLAFTMGGMMAFSTFLPLALSHLKSLDPITAGAIGSTVLLGNLVSALLSPIIAQKIGYYKPYFLTLGLLAGAGIYFGWTVDEAYLTPVMFMTGLCIGGVMPLFMISPALIKSIGPKYAGAAGGIMTTLMLIGAVFIPAIVITPLGGDNYQLIFALSGGCLILMGLCAQLLPEFGPKARRSAAPQPALK